MENRSSASSNLIDYELADVIPTKSTFRFNTLFDKYFPDLPTDVAGLQKIVNNLPKMRTLIRDKKVSLKIKLGTQNLVVYSAGKIGDLDLNFRRFSAIVATAIFRYLEDKKEEYRAIINPLAAEKGIPNELHRIYWGICPGTYMNPDDFIAIPAIFDYLQAKDAASAKIFLNRSLRVKMADGNSVFAMISQNMMSFRQNVQVISMHTGQRHDLADMLIKAMSNPAIVGTVGM